MSTPIALAYRPYRLPLRRPWRSHRGTLGMRQGWLVSAAVAGHVGFGDCAPLPAAGTEGPAAAAARLEHWCGQAGRATGIALLEALGASCPQGTPAADAAVETALMDLAARRLGRPLRRLLAGEADGAILVNAMLGDAATLSFDAVDAALARGFRVLKVKVGTADWPRELARLEAIAARLPAAALLRLDANGAWTPTRAGAVVAALSGLPVESLEEPLRQSDDEVLAGLQAQAPFAIALDESLSARGWPIRPELLPVRRLVLKPTVIGGLCSSLRLARLAAEGGHEVLVTSTLESAAGLWPAAQLAAAMASPLAHGLATAEWLADDLGPPPLPAAGAIALPETPGSGFEPGKRS